MKLNEYQAVAATFATYPEEYAVTYPVLGLASEAGEVAGKLKRILREKQGRVDSSDRAAILKELGDCLWYIAQVGNDMAITLQEIADANIEKLTARKEKGLLHGEGDNREEDSGADETTAGPGECGGEGWDDPRG